MPLVRVRYQDDLNFSHRQFKAALQQSIAEHFSGEEATSVLTLDGFEIHFTPYHPSDEGAQCFVEVVLRYFASRQANLRDRCEGFLADMERQFPDIRIRASITLLPDNVWVGPSEPR